MPDSQNKQIQDIEALLAERRKYEQWIAQLETRRASTPEHVYTKVLADYQGRFQETQGKLSAESGVVQKLVAELSASLATHERQIAEKRDERAEAELRSTVGEYSEKEWDKHRGKLDSAIATLAGARDAIEREHDTLRALLSEATATPQSPIVPVVAVEKAEANPVRAPGGAAQPSEAATAAVPVKKGDVDELAFLRSVLGRSTPFTNSGGQPAVSAPPSDPPPRRDSASIRSTSGASAYQAVEEKESRGSASVSVPTPPDNEVVKTLKCQECGTMNFPTEWYCERCGGELAAL